MKKLKLSKMAWLILSAGIFVVVLAGLGFTYSGQRSQQKTLSEELEVSKTRLQKTQDSGIQQQQIDQLQERLTDSKARLEEAKGKLLQAILSVDVTEKFFQIAESSGVVIKNMGTTDVQPSTISSMPCSKITMHATVEGETLKLIDFIISINENFITGYVTSASISVVEDAEGISSANINLEIYSSKGTENGQ